MNLDEYRQMYELENTHWYFRGKKTVIRKILKKILNSETRYKLLDLGCGTGNILLMLQEFGEAFGVDASPVALEFCRSRNLSHLYAVQPEQPLPFPDGLFDVVCAFDLLEHVEDDVGLLKEITRVVEDQGKVLLIVPAHPRLWSEHDVALHHKRRYTRKQFLQLIQNSNLVCKRMTYLNSILFPAAIGYRTLKNLMPQKKKEAKSEFFFELPSLVNKMLLTAFEVEGYILPHWSLPFGLSLLAICERTFTNSSGHHANGFTMP